VFYFVAYNANGGSGSHVDSNIPADSLYAVKTATEAGVSMPDADFVSWNTQPDGSGVAYLPGQEITMTQNLTLYAQWEEHLYTVSGYVFPVAMYDQGHGPAFLQLFDVAVELRETFLTPAPSELSTVAVPTDSYTGIGVFSIPDVPAGDYVLHIHRAGYLTRAMNVTIGGPSFTITLIPPDSAEMEGGVFRLWAGDANGNLIVDNDDIAILMPALGQSYPSPLYGANLDLNADGTINSIDIMLALNYLGQRSIDYPGAEGVDFNA